jgi:hypothetical protein
MTSPPYVARNLTLSSAAVKTQTSWAPSVPMSPVQPLGPSGPVPMPPATPGPTGPSMPSSPTPNGGGHSVAVLGSSNARFALSAESTRLGVDEFGPSTEYYLILITPD